PPTTPYRSAGAVPTVRERSCLSAAWGSPPRCRRLGSTPAWDGDRYVASPASGFARRVRRRSGRSVRLRPVLGSLLPGSHPTTSTTTHPSPTASLTVQTRQNQGWPSCGSSQSRSRASENHTVAINITGPCDDQAVLHHEMGLTRRFVVLEYRHVRSPRSGQRIRRPSRTARLSPTTTDVLERFGGVQKPGGVVETHVQVGFALAPAHKNRTGARGDVDAADGSVGVLLERESYVRCRCRAELVVVELVE